MFRVTLVLVALLCLRRKFRLVFLPASFFFTYNPIKIGLGDLGIGIDMLALMASSFAILQGTPKGFLGNRIFKSAVVFFGIFIAMNMFNWGIFNQSEDPFSYITYSRPPMPIAPLIKTIFPGVFLLWAMYNDVQEHKDAVLVTRVFMIAGSLAAVHGLLQYHLYIKKNFYWIPFWARFGVNDPEQAMKNIRLGRAFGPTPHCAQYGRSMAYLFIVSLWAHNYKKIFNPNICLIVMALSSLAMFATASLGSTAFVLVASLIMMFATGNTVELRTKVLFVTYFVLIVIFRSVAGPVFEHIGDYSSTYSEMGTFHRFNIWRSYLAETIRRNILIGGSWMGRGEIFDNDFLGVFATGGILGFISFLYMLNTLRSSFTLMGEIPRSKVYAIGARALLTGTLMASITGATIFHPKSVEMLFAYLAIFARLAEFNMDEESLQFAPAEAQTIQMAPVLRKLQTTEAAMSKI